MHVIPILPIAAGLVAALPAGQVSESSLRARQLGGGNTRNDVEDGGTCPEVVLVYARATGERGNLGILGGVIGSALETEFGSVWVQGVGGAYTAGVADNMLPDGTSAAAITEMVGLFKKAAQQCPQATIVTGGYSQGSALCAAAVRDVSPEVRSKIAGAVLFGYTKNAQNDGGIPDYPQENVEVFCNAGDMVCTGSLVVAPAHFAYQRSARGPAPEFLIGRIKAAGVGGGAGAGGAAEGAAGAEAIAGAGGAGTGAGEGGASGGTEDEPGAGAGGAGGDAGAGEGGAEGGAGGSPGEGAGGGAGGGAEGGAGGSPDEGAGGSPGEGAGGSPGEGAGGSPGEGAGGSPGEGAGGTPGEETGGEAGGSPGEGAGGGVGGSPGEGAGGETGGTPGEGAGGSPGEGAGGDTGGSKGSWTDFLKKLLDSLRGSGGSGGSGGKGGDSSAR